MTGSTGGSFRFFLVAWVPLTGAGAGCGVAGGRTGDWAAVGGTGGAEAGTGGAGPGGEGLAGLAVEAGGWLAVVPFMSPGETRGELKARWTSCLRRARRDLMRKPMCAKTRTSLYLVVCIKTGNMHC